MNKILNLQRLASMNFILVLVHRLYPITAPSPHATPILNSPLYFAANLDLALSLAPKKYNTYTPTEHAADNPASKLTPLPTPKL